MSSLESFRVEVKQWVEENCPESIRGSGLSYGGGTKVPVASEDFKIWFDRCFARGFTVPSWPVEYCGAGLSFDQTKILSQEMSAIEAPKPLTGGGVSLLGSTLLEFGTDEQKSRHLPKIARGETRWCQGYSEPGAGSDLASLQTKAVTDGDDYIINGSKIWTSGADKADWIFCLVRTDFNVPKHNGISFILFSMDSPGITVKPIELIAGSSEFCEVFFTDVRVPKKDLIGTENNGWSIAKRLLQFERFAVTEPKASGFSLSIGGLPAIAKKYSGVSNGRIADKALRNQISKNAMDARALELTTQRIKQENASGEQVTVASSILKYYITEITCQEDEIRTRAMGSMGLGWEGDDFTDWEIEMWRKLLKNKASRIAGGSSEVQLNIIAKRVLGLPD